MEELTAEQLRSIAGQAIRDRVRSAVKEALEQILEEEMTEHLGAVRRERSPARTGERNGSYSRDLITPYPSLRVGTRQNRAVASAPGPRRHLRYSGL